MAIISLYACLSDFVVEQNFGPVTHANRYQNMPADESSSASLTLSDYASFFEHSPVPTAVLRYPDCRCVVANQAMVEVGGVPVNGILQHCEIDSLSCPCKEDVYCPCKKNGADKDWFADFRRKLDKGGFVQGIDLLTKHEDGSIRNLLIDGHLVQFEGESHVIISGRDATSDKERERSLRILLEGSNIQLGDDWFRSAARAFAELLDSELVLIAERIDGFPKRFATHVMLEEGQFLKNFTFDIPESLPCPILEGTNMLFEDGIPPEFAGACPFSKQDIRFLQGVPIMNQNGELSGLIVVASTRPVRVKKDHETVFKIFASRAAAEMSRIKSDRAREEARENAEAASRAKGDFLARMSHELRTPMNAILGFSQLLSNDENLSSEQRETLEIINRSGGHLTTLINDILEMSKIEAGESEINRSVFSPAELVNSLAEIFSVRAEAKGLELGVNMPECLAEMIISDENKLRQILSNLLGNALKFTTQGRIELKAWYFSGDESGSKSILAFRVKDSGIGIPEEVRGNLFKSFAHSSPDDSTEEGAGLGLAIAKAFVELLGGQIRMESEPGNGSEFTFWIPCAEVREEKSSGPVDGGIFGTERIHRIVEDQSPTVLIADDQPENRLLVVRFLKSLGFTVIEAVDGQDAIDVFRQSHPAVILMDIRMPGIDGLAATRAIRSMKDAPHQPLIIALTGNAFEDDKEKAFAAGCDAFLAKPFRLEDLTEILSRHLGERCPEVNREAQSELSSEL